VHGARLFGLSIPLAAAVLALVATGSCKPPKQAHVDDALLAQATGVIDAEKGETVVVMPGKDVTIPNAPVVRLAVDRDVPWNNVVKLMHAIESDGNRPVLLVGKRRKTRAFVLSDEGVETDKAIQATATMDGKICVSPPGVAEALCSQRLDKMHISRAGTREMVREAMKGYDLTDVELVAPPELGWADLVRAIDGARTCCKGTKMRVKLRM
jgi:hypothetical protein